MRMPQTTSAVPSMYAWPGWRQAWHHTVPGPSAWLHIHACVPASFFRPLSMAMAPQATPGYPATDAACRMPAGKGRGLVADADMSAGETILACRVLPPRLIALPGAELRPQHLLALVKLEASGQLPAHDR